jgi:hypothetical protein
VTVAVPLLAAGRPAVAEMPLLIGASAAVAGAGPALTDWLEDVAAGLAVGTGPVGGVVLPPPPPPQALMARTRMRAPHRVKIVLWGVMGLFLGVRSEVGRSISGSRGEPLENPRNWFGGVFEA